MIVEIVTATRMQWWTFEAEAPLAKSLHRMKPDLRLKLRIAAGNRRGLPEVYNARIDADDDADILVFVHDDVFIDDFFIADRLLAGLAEFDVIGVAGNTRRQPMQPSWFHCNDAFEADLPHLSGAVAHARTDSSPISYYGATPAACELLDGVFLAARKSTLRDSGVRFDPRFSFHHYDLDFCRSARRAGLRLGTWPLAITHRSTGTFGPEWHSALALYREKWGD